MKIYRFDRDTGRQVDRYNSSGVTLSRMIHQFEEVVIHCAYLEPHGRIGYHQATVPQLFLVIQGDGWVRGEAPERTSIQAGQAAYWEEGEGHESGTETGMTAIIIESTRFNLLEWIPLG
jgi:quercetin dioxygenase-like cupin family protein